MTTPQSAKTCSVCGDDVAKKPRVKDASGRYFCEPCHAKAQAASKAVPASPKDPPQQGAVSGRVQRGDSGRLEMRRAAPGGAIELADGDEQEDKSGLEFCPDCAMPMREDAEVCFSCGFNRKTGRPVGTTFDDGASTPARRQKACGKCGYDLGGLRTAKCPECGHVNVPRGKHELMERMPRRVTGRAGIAPLVILGAWGVLQVVLDLAGAGSILRAGIFLVGACAIGVPAYWVLNVFWIDREEPWWTLALGVTAVYAGGDVVPTLLLASGGLTGAFLWWMYTWTMVLPIIVHGLLYKVVQELEWKESFVAGVVATMISIGAGIVALAVRG